jgi:hypothetical protein
MSVLEENVYTYMLFYGTSPRRDSGMEGLIIGQTDV